MQLQNHIDHLAHIHFRHPDPLPTSTRMPTCQEPLVKISITCLFALGWISAFNFYHHLMPVAGAEGTSWQNTAKHLSILWIREIRSTPTVHLLAIWHLCSVHRVTKWPWYSPCSAESDTKLDKIDQAHWYLWSSRTVSQGSGFTWHVHMLYPYSVIQ